MTSRPAIDVVVLGEGLIGLACARAIERRGLSAALVGHRHPGAASSAGAGVLAPTLDPMRGAALTFACAARDGYAEYLDALHDETGIRVPFSLDGVLQLPDSPRQAAVMAAERPPAARWLDPRDLAEMEPALHAPLGARWLVDDGVVDNQRLLAALDAAVSARAIPHYRVDAAQVILGPGSPVVTLESGERITAARVVIATGAWAPRIGGLPRALPVFPLRGQMLALDTPPRVTRPVFGAGGYIVPRAECGELLVGTTHERAGFSSDTTPEALATFRELARRLIPTLPTDPGERSWSGLRPMSPDGLPLLGPDPDQPALLYACGHSKNGILMAPLTGAVIASLCAGTPTDFDLSPFDPTRFHEEVSNLRNLSE